jgi:hypothetical protein
MNSPLRPIVLSLILIFACLLLTAPCASAAPTIAGTYKITENTDLGTEVRITLQINLYNSGTTMVTVSGVGVHSISAPGRMVTATSSFVVQAESQSQVSLQFLIAKKDFTQWQIGPHQQFLVTFKPAGGKSTLVYLPLLRIPE